MLVTIQLGKRIRIDIRADKELLDRVSAVEIATERLYEDLRTLESRTGDFALADDLLDPELIEDYLSEAEELRSRVADIDFFKADRHHSHKAEGEL